LAVHAEFVFAGTKEFSFAAPNFFTLFLRWFGDPYQYTIYCSGAAIQSGCGDFLKTSRNFVLLFMTGGV
jgi:hypothetical protein